MFFTAVVAMSILLWVGFSLSLGLVVYTYLGYPLLLFILGRLRPKKAYPGELSSTSEQPSLSFLIAAHNEELIVAEKLSNTLSLDYPADKLQILVAADGSDDQTCAIVTSFADKGIDLSYHPRREGKTAAINRALGLAEGEIVVFSDANNMYHKEALKRLVVPFSDPSVGVVTGAKTILRGDGALGDSEGLYWRYESKIKQWETRLGCCTGVAGEILAVRRSLLEPLPEYVINDDFFLAMRIVKRGFRTVYVQDARSFERVSPTAGDEMARRSRIVAGRFQAMLLANHLLTLRKPLVLWQVVSHKFLRPLVPWAMIVAFSTNLAAVGMSLSRPTVSSSRSHLTFWAILLLMQAAFYGLALWGRGLDRRGENVPKWLYLPTFLLSSNIAALQGFARFIRGRPTVLWQRVPRRESTRRYSQ